MMAFDELTTVRVFRDRLELTSLSFRGDQELQAKVQAIVGTRFVDDVRVVRHKDGLGEPTIEVTCIFSFRDPLSLPTLNNMRQSLGAHPRRQAHAAVLRRSMLTKLTLDRGFH